MGATPRGFDPATPAAKRLGEKFDANTRGLPLGQTRFAEWERHGASNSRSGRVVVVSNRVPSLQEAAAGGLATGLKAALERSTGMWFGWSGKITRRPDPSIQMEQEAPFRLETFRLTQADHDGYYVGFANRTLWPLLHNRLDLIRFDADEFSNYLAVNDGIASRLTQRLRRGDRIWIHDYHLIPLGAKLRDKGVAAPVGIFLHTPVPPADLLAALPCHQELMCLMAAYDVIGLQTNDDARHLHDYFVRYLNGEVLADGVLRILGRRVRLEAFPIGIDPDHFSRLAASRDRTGDDGQDRLRIIGVDRLDYTKGLPNRIRAFERLLEGAPHYCGRVELLQIAAPSRECIAEYQTLRDELEMLTGGINARYAEFDWTPVRYLNKTYSQAELARRYRRSRVGLVTPLCDGMNLVAKEYVACQNPADPGVLVLSRFAGAAERLDGAILVNPYDIDAVSRALARALEMPLSERRARWARMMTELRTHTVHTWSRDFLSALERSAGGREIGACTTDTSPVPGLPTTEADRMLGGIGA